MAKEKTRILISASMFAGSANGFLTGMGQVPLIGKVIATYVAETATGEAKLHEVVTNDGTNYFFKDDDCYDVIIGEYIAILHHVFQVVNSKNENVNCQKICSAESKEIAERIAIALNASAR